MSNQPNQLDEILYHGLQPWLESNESYDKFVSLIHNESIVKPDFDSLYEIDFYRPQNPKAEYYYKLIVNETNKYCNKIVTLISEDDNVMRQQHWYDDTIKNILPKRLNDIIEVIKEEHYFIEFINPRKLNFEVTPEHKTDTFILQLLKIAFVKIYLEIQEIFKHLNKEFLLSERDIYDQFFNQNLPENSFLKKNKIATIIEKVPSSSISAIKKDSVSRLSFTYKKFDTDSDKLTDLFQSLKENSFIAKDNPLANFKRAFSGKEVSNQVIWSGSTNEFYYFVHLILNEYKLVEPIKRNYWSVACKCFIRFDGTQFDRKKLKEGVKPEANSELLEDVVKLIK